MVGHLIVDALDRKNPSSLSKKVVSEFLRKKYNFNGLIFTDDLKMLAIRLLYRPEVAAYKAIEAGNDMIMIGPNEKNVDKIIKYVKRKLKKGKIKESEIDERISRIEQIKFKYNINDNPINGINTEAVNKEIDKLNKYVENCINK